MYRIQSVGTAATVGSGYTAAPRITFSGNVAPVRATATVTITEAGVVDTISIGNSGFGLLQHQQLPFKDQVEQMNHLEQPVLQRLDPHLLRHKVQSALVLM